MMRWKIEEYFKAKKQNYGFENFRVRSLRGINNLNLMLSCIMLHIGILADKIDFKLLIWGIKNSPLYLYHVFS